MTHIAILAAVDQMLDRQRCLLMVAYLLIYVRHIEGRAVTFSSFAFFAACSGSSAPGKSTRRGLASAAVTCRRSCSTELRSVPGPEEVVLGSR